EENGCDHEIFSEGLRVSLYNYMRGVGFEMRLQDWFKEDVPKTIISKNFIQTVLENGEELNTRPNAKVLFLGQMPSLEDTVKVKKGKPISRVRLHFMSRKNDEIFELETEIGKWLFSVFPKLII